MGRISMERVKSVTHYDPDILTDQVNALLEEWEGAGWSLVSITFAVAPWAIDGQAGGNYTAFILMELPQVY